MYDPPMFLGTPDLSAAAICALPLAASATRWSELLSASVGLIVGFLAAHLFIVVLFLAQPPSFFYWTKEQTTVVPFGIAHTVYALVVVFAFSRFVRDLWKGEYRRAGWYFLLALVLVGAVAGAIAYIIADARAFEATSPPEVIVFADCVFPPFGEGMEGYSMLAVLVIFELLVAVGIADALNRLWARRRTE
jgi:hypothetical protein